jgi:hypothetical protein
MVVTGPVAAPIALAHGGIFGIAAGGACVYATLTTGWVLSARVRASLVEQQKTPLQETQSAGAIAAGQEKKAAQEAVEWAHRT